MLRLNNHTTKVTPSLPLSQRSIITPNEHVPTLNVKPTTIYKTQMSFKYYSSQKTYDQEITARVSDLASKYQNKDGTIPDEKQEDLQKEINSTISKVREEYAMQKEENINMAKEYERKKKEEEESQNRFINETENVEDEDDLFYGARDSNYYEELREEKERQEKEEEEDRRYYYVDR